MSCFDFLRAGLLALLALVALVEAKTPSKLGDPCFDDSDCGVNTECWYYDVSPACQLGTCQCEENFFKISTNSIDCYARIPLPLNASCSNNELEQYPRGAYCYGSLVQCKQQYQPSFNNTCALLPTVQSEYGARCLSDAQCNSEIGLFCNLAWQSCTCFSKYIWQGDSCQEAYYGSPCETDDNCQTGGAYALGGPGNGGVCDAIQHACVCAQGFTTVNFTQFYLDPSGETNDMLMNTWTICVVSELNAVNLALGDNCTVTEWSSATSLTRQRYCKAGLACIICPETLLQGNTSSLTIGGNCRNGGEVAVFRSNNFAAAALLSVLSIVCIRILLLSDSRFVFL